MDKNQVLEKLSILKHSIEHNKLNFFELQSLYLCIEQFLRCQENPVITFAIYLISRNEIENLCSDEIVISNNSFCPYCFRCYDTKITSSLPVLNWE